MTAAIRPPTTHHGSSGAVDVAGENEEQARVVLMPAKEVAQEENQEEVTGNYEARVPRTYTTPELPSAKEVAEHNLSHDPYRSWCPVCVEAQGKEDSHRRDGGHEHDGGIPTIGMDYGFYGEGLVGTEEKGAREDEVKALIMKDYTTGAMWGHVVTVKGPGDEWAMKQAAADIEYLGRRDVRLKTDGEPAIVAVQSNLIARRAPPRKTLPTNPPRFDPQANGCIEKGMQDYNVQLRKLKIALERNIQQNIPCKSAILEWMVEHAGFLHTRYVLGRDGKTAYERLTGRRFMGRIVEFGEQVRAKLAKPMQRGRNKAKLKPKWASATWVGISQRTGEHRVVLNSGKAVRVRTIKRKPLELRWDAEKILNMKATPRRPDPSDPKKDEVQNGEDLDKLVMEDIVIDEGEAQGSKPPEIPIRANDVRELRMTKKILDKYGRTPECPGCMASQTPGAGPRLHTDACRGRIYQEMGHDEQDRHMIERALMRQMQAQEIRDENKKRKVP